ncbi:ABC transporter substrate-binding protein [Calderihabitans maritimus]|uniref:Lipoprotein n=1 Tax=Calderihabitans maritimus TaxID=1246530 RepID=A0A1Z5HRR2_9FIRM|nr:ABC transporter substrate-binding protein [Calderihabitans maritimus]GAW92011.1 lipoprotein [Calderihabitans maritimus]
MAKKRLIFLTMIALLVILVVSMALTDNEEKKPVFRVGVLVSGDARLAKLSGLKEGLKTYGYYEGENVHFIVKNARYSRERVFPMARELVALHPDVIVAAGGIEAEAAKLATEKTEIPVVFMGVASSVETGLVKSLRNPGANITGVDNFHVELTGKRLEFLQKLLPEVRKVIILYDPIVRPTPFSLQKAQEVAEKLGILPHLVAVNSRQELGKILSPVNNHEVDAILILPSFNLESATHQLVEFSFQKKIPVIGVYAEEVEQGYLASYGVSFHSQGFQAARLVAKVLRGQDPAGIPVELPEDLRLVVNLSTARVLGLNISPFGLSYADVILDRKQEGVGPGD